MDGLPLAPEIAAGEHLTADLQGAIAAVAEQMQSVPAPRRPQRLQAMHQISHPLARIQGEGVSTPGPQPITELHHGGVRGGDHIEISVARGWRT